MTPFIEKKKKVGAHMMLVKMLVIPRSYVKVEGDTVGIKNRFL